MKTIRETRASYVYTSGTSDIKGILTNTRSLRAEKCSFQLISFPTKFVLGFLMWGSINEAPGAGMHTTTAGHSEGPLRSNSSCHDIGRELQTFASVERMHGAAAPCAAPSHLWCSSHAVPPFLCLHNLLLLWDHNFSSQQFPVLFPPMLNCPHSLPVHSLPPPLPFPHFPPRWDLHISAPQCCQTCTLD